MFNHYIQQQSRMINRNSTTPSKCTSCDTISLSTLGTQTFCTICNRFLVEIEPQVKVVPQQYVHNQKKQVDVENEKKMKYLFKEVSSPYFTISEDELRTLRQKFIFMKDNGNYRFRYHREAAAVIFYVEYKDLIKLTIRQFCRKHQILNKNFNKKYIIYWNLFGKNMEASQIKLPQKQYIKFEEKQEEDGIKQVTEAYEQDYRNMQINPIKGIQVIYDDIFSNFYFQEKKSYIIDRINKKMMKTNKKILELIKFKTKPDKKIYYLIFAVLKMLKHTMSFKNFAQIVEQRTGQYLKVKFAGYVRRLYEQFRLQDDSESESEEPITDNVSDKLKEESFDEDISYQVQKKEQLCESSEQEQENEFKYYPKRQFKGIGRRITRNQNRY